MGGSPAHLLLYGHMDYSLNGALVGSIRRLIHSIIDAFDVSSVGWLIECLIECILRRCVERIGDWHIY